MALAEDAELDLRRACIHEYAHFLVARELGAAGFVTISCARDELSGRPRFGGCFQMHGELAADEWRIVALAGAIAECVLDDDEIAAPAILGRLSRGDIELSGPDAVLAAEYDAGDVTRCLAIVRRAFPMIAAEAEAHIES